MEILSFKIKGNSLIRTDMNRLIAYTRNNAFCKFEVDNDWQGVSPLVAQFRRGDSSVYDSFIEDGKCPIPWEVLEGEGKLDITVCGGDLLITNSVEVNVYDSGLVGGLVATEASPGIYGTLLGKINGIISSIAEKLETKLLKAENIKVYQLDADEKINTEILNAHVEINASNINADGIEVKDAVNTQTLSAKDNIETNILNANEVNTNILNADEIKANKLSYKESIDISSSNEDGGEVNYISLTKENGIKVINNDTNSVWYIKIGEEYKNSAGDAQMRGVMACLDCVEQSSNAPEFFVGDTESRGFVSSKKVTINLTPNSSGSYNVIRGNETLEIMAENTGLISFDTENAGIVYDKATWTERFKQLDIELEKGINIQAKNNSYFFVDANKKAVYGNALNKLEFRTDGVAKFSDAVNAKDYQISGISVKNTLADKQDISKIVSVTDTTINIVPNKIYTFSKATAISELNITLSDIIEGQDNDFVVKFVSAIDDMAITITDNTNSDIMWHNEPKVLAGKAYTLAICVTGDYKEAVLSYAE